jgi:hypothetical protein
MTTAYSVRLPLGPRPYVQGPHLHLVVSAPAQGHEARKVRENVRAISCRAAALANSTESRMLKAAIRDLAESIEPAQALMHGDHDVSYMHVPVKPVFTVQATYKFIGKLKPRQFPVDE